jgi:hypothetical protein
MTFIFADFIRGAAWKIFTRNELDDNDMHPKQCTQNLFWFNGEATSGDFLCCSTPPRQRGIQAGLPIHPISRCITFFSFEICTVCTCQGFIPVETKSPEEPQTVQTGTCERVGWDAEKGKRPRDWQKYRTRNVSLAAGYSEDRGKRRAERPGSDTRRHSSE